MKLTQRLKLRLTGHVHVGDRQRNGWRTPLPFYAWRCPVHGTVESYPTGYEGLLICPKCLEEKK